MTTNLIANKLKLLAKASRARTLVLELIEIDHRFTEEAEFRIDRLDKTLAMVDEFGLNETTEQWLRSNLRLLFRLVTVVRRLHRKNNYPVDPRPQSYPLYYRHNPQTDHFEVARKDGRNTTIVVRAGGFRRTLGLDTRTVEGCTTATYEQMVAMGFIYEPIRVSVAA